jgi:hypothetical protein
MDNGTGRRTAITDSGVRIGTVDGAGMVRDHRGIRIGSATPDGAVIDFAGVRIGRVAELAAAGSGRR